MLITNSRAVAHAFRRKLGWDENEAGDKEIEAAFFIRGKGTAMVAAQFLNLVFSTRISSNPEDQSCGQEMLLPPII